MAYVPVPKDFSKIKTKLALNLTKRQIICFSLAGICGVPVYLLTKAVFSLLEIHPFHTLQKRKMAASL